MAGLTHEQLLHVCQRKPGDFAPYENARNWPDRSLLRMLVVPHAERRCLQRLERLPQSPESSRWTPHV